ncbi:hypothetical protein ECP029894210_3194 [Escherichia coli P0298942.10]|nr:hypothetical protein ECP02989421_3370 [Escherichia coli P0298942.1]ENB38337.1 hypothetical protein ECP029894210_3194 [Escherichia coli P0298942.10]ENB59740.1 hypothetical protein ECP029894215_3306 [Escherichia coli P0298942.15]ENG83493.1 hypothetical protein ECP029894212_3227 [Escherichia coli P0298942.12]
MNVFHCASLRAGFLLYCWLALAQAPDSLRSQNALKYNGLL